MRNPEEANKPLKVGGLSPYLLWLMWVLWLFFLIPAFTELFQAHLPLPRLIADLVGITLFIGIYLWATWRNVQDRVALAPPASFTFSMWLPVVLLTALSLALAPGLFLTPSNGKDWLDLFILTSAYAAGRFPTRWAVLVVIVLMFLTAIVIRLTEPNWFALGQPLVTIAVVTAAVISMVRLVTTSWELSAAREEIARLAVMTERLRIARDLHDLLGHNLSLIALKSELAGRLIGVKPERAAIEIGDVENVARTTLQEVREALASYRQPTLANELHAAQEILAAAGIAYCYEGDENMGDNLPSSIEAVLAWAVREGVTNVIRHSRAQKCIIHATRKKQTACVEVLDDGTASSMDSTGNGGNGLRGLAERVTALGGQFEAAPHVGGGFRLAVSVPLARRAETLNASTASPAQLVPMVSSEHSDRYEERSTQL
ncbi:MAG: histidine kinase [Chloroflexota bacterium]|nr:histidine kinase [Chloroflexota bacterium]